MFDLLKASLNRTPCNIASYIYIEKLNTHVSKKYVGIAIVKVPTIIRQLDKIE